MSYDPYEFQPQLVYHVLNVAFDTPGILTGVRVLEPSVGDVLVPLGWVSVPTAWDGTTPVLHVLPEGGTVVTDDFMTASGLDAADTAIGANHWTANIAFEGKSIMIGGDTPIVAIVDDGAGGDPECSVGEARIVVAVASSRSTSGRVPQGEE